MLALWKKSYGQSRQHIKSRDITLTRKVLLVKAMVFRVVMYRCESWTIKKTEYWRTDAFELWCWRKLLSSLDCKEIKPVNPKKNKPWIFIGRPDAETEAPILWPFDANSRLIGKDADGGKDWRQEEKRITEDVMVGWHYRLNGHELSKLRELAMDREAWRAAVHGVTKSRHDWATELNCAPNISCIFAGCFFFS